MSRSPRRNLRMALDALNDMAEVCARYPEARAAVEAALGPELVREVNAAREVLARAAARVDRAGGEDPAEPG